MRPRIGDKSHDPPLPDWRDIQIHAIHIEIHPRHLGLVSLLRLIGWPVWVKQLLVKDAVIDEKLANRPKIALNQARCPGLEDRVGAPADFLEQLGIPKAGVAVADQGQDVAAPDQQGAELKIPPQPLQSGRGRYEL